MNFLLRSWHRVVALVAIALVCSGCGGFLPTTPTNPWEVLQLPTESTLQDVAFTDDPNHGWLVGSHATLMESTDAGSTWELRPLELDPKNRLTSVSFSGQEGWIAGQPSILLHTLDGGQSWSQVPLSEKLPGSPNTILALGPQSAEMTTDVGAIYRTADGGKSWKATVEEAFGVLRNISRAADGRYVAVSSRGSFYSVWQPGQTVWQPYNRNSSRRVQNMGFTADGRLWMLARGGQLQFTSTPDPDTWEESVNPELATSWGLLDLAYRTPDEIWVSGGSGNLLRSLDGGKTWEKDQAIENVPSNLYRIVFLSPDQGFILGQRGTLLRYVGAEASA